jgi:hypothetical protein
MGYMAEVSILQVLILLAVMFIVFGPAVHIVLSKRSCGGAKFAWFIAAIAAPIITYIAFLIITKPIEDKPIRYGS